MKDMTSISNLKVISIFRVVLQTDRQFARTVTSSSFFLLLFCFGMRTPFMVTKYDEFRVTCVVTLLPKAVSTKAKVVIADNFEFPVLEVH